MKKILLLLSVFLILTGCAADRCNDYTVAYECVEKYGTSCRAYYLDMVNQCEINCKSIYFK